MVGRPKSGLKRNQEALEDAEELKRRAVSAYLSEQEKAHSKGRAPPGVRRIAAQYGVGWRALSRHVRGGKTKLEWAEQNSHLNPVEAQVLIDFTLHMADCGFPLTHDSLRKYALEIKCIREPDAKPFGPHWNQRFIAKFGAQLSTKWSTALDTTRAAAVNPIKISTWFELLGKVFDTYKFKPGNIYNMDESGFPIGKGSKRRIITRPGTRTQHKVEDGNRENVTVMCTICADGTSLPPVVIFKGKNFQARWVENNPLKAAYVLYILQWVHTKVSILLESAVLQRVGQMVKLERNGSSVSMC
jgi:hypothetical protein